MPMSMVHILQPYAAGSNLEMPSCGYDSAREVIAAVRNGKLKEADLDERVGELVDAVMELNYLILSVHWEGEPTHGLD